MEEGLCLLESFNLLCACTLSRFSHVQFSVTPWTIAHQAPPSMGFSRQKYWSGLPCHLQGIFLTQRLSPCLLCLLHWQVGSLPVAPPGKPLNLLYYLSTNKDLQMGWLKLRWPHSNFLFMLILERQSGFLLNVRKNRMPLDSE